MIRIDGHVRIGEEDFQSRSPLAHIVQRLDERIARRKALAPELSIDPVEEHLDHGLGVREAVQLLGLAEQFAFPYLILDRVQDFDLLDGLGGAAGLSIQRLEKATARMRPALSVGEAGSLGVTCVRRVTVAQEDRIGFVP